MEPSREAIKLSAFVPMQFTVNIDVPAAFGSEARGQVAINDRPFILEFITHQIVPEVLEPDSQAIFVQDGLYTLDWSLFEQARFWKGVPPMADTGYGSIRHGVWIKLPAPVSLPGNETLHVIVRNMFPREDPFRIQVIFHGIQRGGSLSQVGQ
jgi:hypothetical protein